MLVASVIFRTQDYLLNTFASELFCLGNASKLTHEFLNVILNKKILINFLVKNDIQKNTWVNFDAFSRQNGPFIFPQNRGAQKKKVLIIFFRLTHNRFLFIVPIRIVSIRGKSVYYLWKNRISILSHTCPKVYFFCV